MGNISSWPLPWPVKSCTRSIIVNDNSEKVLNAILSGELGDTDDWLGAQKRWDNEGISENDYLYIPERGLPFDKSIGLIGYPAIAAGAIVSGNEDMLEAAVALHKLWVKSKHTDAEKYIRSDLIFLLGVMSRFRYYKLTPEIVKDLPDILSASRSRERVHLDILNFIPENQFTPEETDEILRLVCDFDKMYPPKYFTKICQYIENQIVKSPEHSHLLELLTLFVIEGYKVESPTLLPVLERIQNPNLALVYLSCINDIERVDVCSKFLELYSSGKNHNITDDILKTIKNHKLSGECLEDTLSDLYGGISHEKWQDRQKILEEMREQQQKHLSYSQNFL